MLQLHGPDSLLGQVFSLNRDLPAFFSPVIPVLEQKSAELAAQTLPVDPTEVLTYLGLDTEGFQVRLDDACGLRLDHDSRSFPLLSLMDGTYVVTDGPAWCWDER